MKICAKPGCPELARSGSYCARHRPARTFQHTKKTAERGYGGAHQRWRKAVLRRDPICVDCLAAGRATPATDADHIDGNPFNRALDNGRGLCRTCHNRRTHGADARARHAEPAAAKETDQAWSFA